MLKTRPLSEVDVAAVAAGQGPCATAGRDSGTTVGATIKLGGMVHAVGWLRGGMKHQLKPNAAKENMDKLKYQADSTYVTIEAKHADAQRHADRKNVVCLTNHEDALGIDANTTCCRGHDAHGEWRRHPKTEHAHRAGHDVLLWP
jgi:hypothetical protein